MTGTVNGKTYGTALFELSGEEGIADKVLSELKAVRSALDSNPEYYAFLNLPSLSTEERTAAVCEDFKDASEYVKNLLCILTENRTSKLFGEAADEFERLYDTANGILKVTAVSAVPLTDSQRTAIAEKLIRTVEGTKQVVIENTVDPSIIGGLILRYAGVQTDASLALQLKTMQASFSK